MTAATRAKLAATESQSVPCTSRRRILPVERPVEWMERQLAEDLPVVGPKFDSHGRGTFVRLGLSNAHAARLQTAEEGLSTRAIGRCLDGETDGITRSIAGRPGRRDRRVDEEDCEHCDGSSGHGGARTNDSAERLDRSRIRNFSLPSA